MANQLLSNADKPFAEGELLDRAALITGAASGIGLVISRRIYREGALIAMLDINDETLQIAKNDLAQGGDIDAINTAPDVAEPGDDSTDGADASPDTTSTGG